MTVYGTTPVFFDGGPARARGGAEQRSCAAPFTLSGSPMCEAHWGKNGQIVIARGAKDERLV